MRHAPLVLASASPARRRLLEQACIPHRVQVSGVDEDAWRDPDPLQLVLALARAKAEAVERDLVLPEREQACGVLGCDSLFVLDGAAYGKPRDAEEAISRWRRMAGSWGNCIPAIACCSLWPKQQSQAPRLPFLCWPRSPPA